MSYRIAKFIATILNPLVLISLVPYILIHRVTKDLNTAIYWTEISFAFITVFSAFVLFGIWRGYFSNLDVSIRKERTLLYSFAVLLSIIYLGFLFLLHAPFVLFIGIIALSLGLAIAEIINLKIKLSLHVGTLVAFSTALVLIYGVKFAPVFLLVPIMAWSRLTTKNHTTTEVIAGTIVGFMLTIAVYIAFKYIM